MFVADVAEGDADVAEEAAAFGAEDGCAGEFLFEGRGVEVEELEEGWLVKVGAGRGFHERACAREAVPWTGCEAIVAAVNAVADGGAELLGNGALEFDGEVGDATSGVELEGGGDGGGGTGLDASSAGAAAVRFRGVGFEFEGGDDLGEKYPVAELAADEVGVFADEAEAGAHGQIALEERAGIGVPEGAGFRAAEMVHEFGELPEGGGEDIVVILVAGVASDEACSRNAAGGFGFRTKVTHREGENALRAGKDLARVNAFEGVSLEISHGAVPAFREPLLEGGGVAGRLGSGDAAVIKPKLEGLADDALLHCLGSAWTERNW